MTAILDDDTSIDRLQAVVAGLETIFDDLEPLQQEFADVVGRSATPTAETLASLRPSIRTLLDRHRGLVAGSGVITAPGLLGDEPRWLEWWWVDSVGSVRPLRVNLDQQAPEFFDYTTAEWYAVPVHESRRHLAGPYVDYFCSNTYTMTFAVPVHVAGRPIGVAAADVLVSVLEQRLTPILRRIGTGAVVTSGSGRVIASGSAEHAPGELLRVDSARAVPLRPGRASGGGTADMRCWLPAG